MPSASADSIARSMSSAPRGSPASRPARPSPSCAPTARAPDAPGAAAAEASSRAASRTLPARSAQSPRTRSAVSGPTPPARTATPCGPRCVARRSRPSRSDMAARPGSSQAARPWRSRRAASPALPSPPLASAPWSALPPARSVPAAQERVADLAAEALEDARLDEEPAQVERQLGQHVPGQVLADEARAGAQRGQDAAPLVRRLAAGGQVEELQPGGPALGAPRQRGQLHRRHRVPVVVAEEPLDLPRAEPEVVAADLQQAPGDPQAGPGEAR